MRLNGKETGPLESSDLDRRWLESMQRKVQDGKVACPEVVLVAREGRVVYERCWNGHSREELHDLRSATDWLRFVLDLPMAAELGGVASYCTGWVVVLGAAAGVDLIQSEDSTGALGAPLRLTRNEPVRL